MSSPEDQKPRFRRNYKACLNCRLRKVKCELGSVDNPIEGKCARCRRERRDCVFVESKRGGQSHKRKEGATPEPVGAGTGAGTAQLPGVNDILNNSQSPGTKPGYSHSASISPIPSPEPGPKPTFSANPNLSATPQQYYLQSNLVDTKPDKKKPDDGNFSSMEGALVYLAKAAGTIAKADERDNIDANQKHQLLEQELNRRHDPNHIPGIDGSRKRSNENGSPDNNEDSHKVNNKKYRKLITEDSENIPKHIRDQSNYLSIPITNEFLIRPKGSNKLSNIDYIGENGLLTEYEAEMLVNLFFTTMHPYFPHIPNFLHKPQVLAGYPILLCAILTIASRYHSLDDTPNKVTTGNVDGVPRNIEIHDKLWLYVQRLISQTVWAEASTRSIGTIFAFLLLTEWNPRAIHWRWSDYANIPEDDNSITQLEQSSNTNNEQTLAGLGAMRRSYRMGWMLIGSAVRLAQDMGFMDVSPKTFLATHTSEINGVMNISRRSMLSYSLSEVEIEDDSNNMSDDDNDEQIIDMSEEEIREKSSEPLKFNFKQRAKIELLQIMSLSHESLYGHKAHLGNLSQRQNLAVLNIISPLINGWERKYKSLLRPSKYKQYSLHNFSSLLDQNSKLAKDLYNCIEYESFIFEFNYAKLYVYSLALSSSSKTELDNSDGLSNTEANGDKSKYFKRKSKKVNLKLDEISKSAKYIEQAFFAADEMLAVAHRVHKLKTLRFMPVRWVTRIVRAVAFIVKCYLTITAHKKLTNTTTEDMNSNTMDSFDATILSLSLIPVDEIMFSIQKAAITLRDCSPDELHLCTRYSNVLMYLCSEMKTNSKNFNESSKDLNSSNKINSNRSYPGSDSSNANSGANSNFNNSKMNSSVNLANQTFNKSFPFNDQNETTSSVRKPQAVYGNDIMDSITPSLNSTAAASSKNHYEPSNDEASNSNLNRTSSPALNAYNEPVPSTEGGTPMQNLIGDSEVIEWFINNKNVGLDFVAPWTEMIEQQLNSDEQFNFNDAFN